MAKKTAKKSPKPAKSAKPSGAAKPKTKPAKPAKAAKPSKAEKRAKGSDAGAKAAKAEPKHDPKHDVKALKKPDAKSDAKADAKADTKADAKASSKPEAKSKGAEKAPAGAAAKAVAGKGEGKIDPKAAAKGAAGKGAVPAKAGAKPAPGRGDDAEDGLDDALLDDGVEARGDAKGGASDADKKSGRKGITIVTPKPVKKSKAGPTAATIVPPGLSAFLLKGLGRKPLIPSGPKAAATRPLGAHGGGTVEEAPRPPAKTPFTKKELDRYRQILLRKRAELVGDVNRMESEALQNDAGALSNMPSHMAEQGSDASDQSLSLDLAAADRKLIREIDAAIKRIDAGTYGICEHTGTPIKLERLEELPWARYSIEAAREIERFAMRPS